MASLNHAGFAGYTLRARLDTPPTRADGSVALAFDGNMHIVLHPAGRGDLVLEAQVRALPVSRLHADDALMDGLSVASRRSALDADYLVLSQNEERLMLQQRVGAAASADEFEIALGRFLDSLTAWRAHFRVL